MTSKDLQVFEKMYAPRHESKLEPSKIYTINHSVDTFPSGDIFKSNFNTAILVDSPLSGKDADKVFGDQVLLDLTQGKAEDSRSTYAQVKFENEKLLFRARGSTGIVCWEQIGEEIVPTILHFCNDYDPGELSEGSMDAKNILGWMMFSDGGLDILWQPEISGNMPGYDKFDAFVANNKIHEMKTTPNHKTILLYQLLSPITNSISKIGFEETSRQIAINGLGDSGKSPKDDSLVAMGAVKHIENEPKLPFLFSPQIIEAQQANTEENKANQKPLKEFTANPDELKHIEARMNDLKLMIENIRHYATGMTYDRVMPHILEPNNSDSIFAIKRSRHVAPEKVIKDTKVADDKALAHGFRNFAPSFKVGEFIVQKWLLEDNTISEKERRWALEDFLSRLRRMGGSIDNALENVIVTQYGPATPDTMSIHWNN